MRFPSSNRCAHTWHAVEKGPRVAISARAFCTARLSRNYREVRDGFQVPATERWRWRPFLAERRHRKVGSCRGDFERHPCQGCLWLGRCPSGHDSSTFPSIRYNELLIHVYLGFYGQEKGLRRARLVLCSSMSSPRPGVGW